VGAGDIDDLEWGDLDESRSDVEVFVDKALARPDRVAMFTFVRRGQTLGGFVVLTGAGPRAYVNRCPHVPYSLDFGDGDVLHEGAIVCANHGARFEPTSGRCVWGPARGRGLEALPLEDRGEVWRVLVDAGPHSAPVR
jgi:nitrite reductase/ring-hydroxylating ferredoxin subunit